VPLGLCTGTEITVQYILASCLNYGKDQEPQGSTTDAVTELLCIRGRVAYQTRESGGWSAHIASGGKSKTGERPRNI